MLVTTIRLAVVVRSCTLVACLLGWAHAVLKVWITQHHAVVFTEGFAGLLGCWVLIVSGGTTTRREASFKDSDQVCRR